MKDYLREPTVEQLKEACILVRQAAQQVSDEKIANYPSRFPEGWCGIASRVLGAWLLEQFPGCEFAYLCRYLENGCSHAWIAYKNLFLDITADQFEGCDDKIIVKDGCMSEFHLQFSERDHGMRLIVATDKDEYPENVVYQRVQALSKAFH